MRSKVSDGRLALLASVPIFAGCTGRELEAIDRLVDDIDVNAPRLIGGPASEVHTEPAFSASLSSSFSLASGDSVSARSTLRTLARPGASRQDLGPALHRGRDRSRTRAGRSHRGWARTPSSDEGARGV